MPNDLSEIRPFEFPLVMKAVISFTVILLRIRILDRALQFVFESWHDGP